MNTQNTRANTAQNSTKTPAKEDLLITLESLAEVSALIERGWDGLVAECPELKAYSVRYAIYYTEENGTVTAMSKPISRELAETFTLPPNHKLILAINLYESEFDRDRQKLLAQIGEKGARNSKFQV